jgi:hypothetical protein
MTKLNQIIAIEQGEKARANKATVPLFHAAKNPALFAGLTRTYEPVEDGGETLPDESARVQWTVAQVITEFVKASARQLDVSATKDMTNTTAFADVVIGDEVLLHQMPVTFLLPFEKYLTQEVRGLVESLPVLDPAQDWTPSAIERVGVYEAEAVRRHRTKKVVRPIELAAATDNHPAQVQLVNEDLLAGYWNEKKFSGAVPAARKAELVDRVETLIAAVKFAREKANDTQVDNDVRVGEQVFGYLFG